jgi:methyl-accepting chemotaxis protein
MASIQRKIILASIAIFALAGGATGVGIWSASLLSENSSEIARSGQILRNHMQADMMHDALRSDVLASLLSSNPAAAIETDAVKADLAEHDASFREMIEANKNLANDEATKTILARVEPTLLAYIASATRVVDLAGREPSAALRALPEFMKQFSELEAAMEQAGDQIAVVSETISLRGKKIEASVGIVLKALLGVTALFALALYFLTRKTVTNPILSLSGDMQRLAGGDTASICTGIGRTDEIGVMASAVEVFRQAAIANRQLEQDAEAARMLGEVDRATARKQADDDAAERLQAATSGLAAGLKRLASGDLAFQIDEPFSPDFESLRHDFNMSVRQLEQTLGAIATAITAIDEGTW